MEDLVALKVFVFLQKRKLHGINQSTDSVCYASKYQESEATGRESVVDAAQ